MILDFHTHIFPDNLARRALITMSELSMLEFHTNATGSSLKASMREAGVTHSVICNIAVKQGQTANIVNFAKEILHTNSPNETEQLIPLASVHPRDADSLQWLAKIKEDGFAGIKLHPDYQKFYINDADLEPFYKEAIRLGLVMLFHTGIDAGYPDPIHATPERILDVLPIFEQGNVILAHLGGYEMQDKVLQMICGRNVYFDTAYNLDKIPVHQMREIIRKHSPEKILLASDSPWVSQKHFVNHFTNKVVAGFLSNADCEKIMWHNGAKLLGV